MVETAIVKQLLTDLHAQDIKVWVSNGQLHTRALPGAITPILRAQLQQQKAELIALLSQAEEGADQAAIQSIQRPAKLPLSYAQQRLWFLEALGSNSAYNIPFSLCLTGELNIAALVEALDEVVRRHESLRTTCAMIEGAPQPIIHPAQKMEVPVIDLRPLVTSRQKEAIQQWVAKEALTPFEISQDLMLRGILLQIGEEVASQENLSLSLPNADKEDGKQEAYILLLTMHHIASDGWSIGILVQELSALYAAFSQGEPSPLPELTIQYADFAVWQRHYLQGEVLEKQVKWWKEQLADAPALLQLPTDRPRPTQQSFRGSLVRGEIEATLTQRLRELSRRQGATLYMTLLAAFQILLHRYSGQDDIVVGSPIANRNRAELEPLIGFFVNTLALRSNLADNPSFLELLTHVQQTTQAAYDHQDLPFERLVEELHPERNLAYTPVVQVMFALQNAAMGDFELPGLRVSALEFAVQTTRVDLELHVREVGDSLQLYAVYSSDLFDASTIERLVAHYQELLKGIVANPAQAIATLPLLTEAERHQLLVEWNNTASDYPKDKTIHQLFEEQVERTPDAVAVVMAGEQGLETRDQRLSAVESPVPSLQSLTYAELNARANQLAHHLRSLGVAPDVLVGICVERSIEMVVGFLGILKAGGAYVPLDPTYPLERLAFMLQDTAVSVLLTQSHLLDRLPGTTAQVVCLDQNAPMIQEFSTSTPKVAMGSENLAYVIYTSGSTGQPKGVMIQHNNVANLITWHQTVYQLTTNDHTTQVATPAFDAVVWEVWPTLTAGATLHIMDDSTRGEPSQLLQWLSNHAITVSFLPTPLAEVVLNERCADALSLRLLLTGGDMLRYWPTSDIPFTVVNNYGPTENTVVTTWAALTSEHIQGKLPPIGRPVFNTQVYLLDRKLQPVPIGVSGELYIGGASLARCYHNRPELTDEKFIPNSFGLGKLYKTGDLARWLPDGNIEFLGRIDQQVKLRGFRIELGEIEAVLSQHPDVHEAVVVVREEQANNQQLVAYLVADGADAVVQSEHLTTWQSLYESSYSQPAVQEEPDLNLTGWNSSYTGQPIAEAEMVAETNIGKLHRTLIPQVRSFLQSKLPDYMIPNAFVLLDKFPLTPNGKIDRKSLPAPHSLNRASDQPFVAPGTDTERALAGIWRELLGLEKISIDDNFFDLGGHSLLATQVVSKIRAMLGIEIPLKNLFANPTICHLSNYIQTHLLVANVAVSVFSQHKEIEEI
jgi:amino acid adenylation domain-containing protein